MQTLAQALGQTLAEAMKNDARVVLLGEEVLAGGLNGVTRGLAEKFGPSRVLEPGGGESGLVDFALGAALQGMRPVVELSDSDGLLAALASVAQAAEMAWRSGDGLKPKLVLRCPYGGGVASTLGARNPETWLTALGGLGVVVPSCPQSGATLLTLALEAEGPVVLLEPRLLYHRRGLVGAKPQRLGQAVTRREGGDVLAVGWGAVVPRILEAAENLAGEDISVEVLDLMGLSPLDEAAILEAVERLGRPVIVHEGPQNTGFGAELSARIAEKAVLRLEAPILRVCGTAAASSFLADPQALPGVDSITQALREAAFY